MMRRGQAALEYLWTYGYAFLAILITLGVLTYFGVFDVSFLRTQECVFPPGAYCQDYTLTDELSGSDELRMDLLNTFGTELNVTAAIADNEDLGQANCVPDGSSFPVNWSEEGFLNLTCDLSSWPLADGNHYAFTVRVNMSQMGHDYVHTLLGRVATIAQ